MKTKDIKILDKTYTLRYLSGSQVGELEFFLIKTAGAGVVGMIQGRDGDASEAISALLKNIEPRVLMKTIRETLMASVVVPPMSEWDTEDFDEYFRGPTALAEMNMAFYECLNFNFRDSIGEIKKKLPKAVQGILSFSVAQAVKAKLPKKKKKTLRDKARS